MWQSVKNVDNSFCAHFSHYHTEDLRSYENEALLPIN